MAAVSRRNRSREKLSYTARVDTTDTPLVASRRIDACTADVPGSMVL